MVWLIVVYIHMCACNVYSQNRLVLCKLQRPFTAWDKGNLLKNALNFCWGSTTGLEYLPTFTIHLSHSCRSTIHIFGTFGRYFCEKNDLSWLWFSGALSGFYSSLWAVGISLETVAQTAKKETFSQPYDSWVGWEDSMTRHSVFFVGFGKVQHNQKLPRELHFPNHRSNDTNSVVTYYPCTFGGTRISENNPSSIFFQIIILGIHVSFWECMQIYWRMSSGIYVMSFEFILQSCVWFERLRNRSHDLCSGSFRVLFVVPNLDFVHWAMMFNTHPLYVSS